MCTWLTHLTPFFLCRLLHHPALYKEIHKLHHEWTAPVGVVSIYAHPIEHVLANLVPAVAGPLLMGAHVAMLWLWLGIVIVTTVIHHSGYHFPFMSSPEFHDFHHLKWVLRQLNFRASQVTETNSSRSSLVVLKTFLCDSGSFVTIEVENCFVSFKMPGEAVFFKIRSCLDFCY